MREQEAVIIRRGKRGEHPNGGAQATTAGDTLMGERKPHHSRGYPVLALDIH